MFDLPRVFCRSEPRAQAHLGSRSEKTQEDYVLSVVCAVMPVTTGPAAELRSAGQPMAAVPTRTESDWGLQSTVAAESHRGRVALQGRVRVSRERSGLSPGGNSDHL